MSSASDCSDGSREADTPKEGSSYGRHVSLRDRRHSPSPSRSPGRSESRHRGISSSSKGHSRVKKDSHSHSHKHSGKRKHRDRSASPDDRKRRKHKEREREKDKEISREKEKLRKKDEERRSVLTGKKVCPVSLESSFFRSKSFFLFLFLFVRVCRSSSKSRRIKAITREMLIEKIYFNFSTRLSSKKKKKWLVLLDFSI